MVKHIEQSLQTGERGAIHQKADCRLKRQGQDGDGCPVADFCLRLGRLSGRIAAQKEERRLSNLSPAELGEKCDRLLSEIDFSTGVKILEASQVIR